MREDSIAALTGDPAAAELMRRALRERAEEYADTPLGKKFADVLAGRLDARSLADGSGVRWELCRSGPGCAFEDYWAGLDAGDRREATMRAGEHAKLAKVARGADP